MVEHFDLQKLAGAYEITRHLDVCSGWGRVMAGVIVCQRDGRRVRHDCAFEHFARMYQQRVQCAGTDDFKADGVAPRVEMHDDEILHVGPVDQTFGQLGPQVIHEPVGIVQRIAGGQRVIEARHLELGSAQFGSPYFHFSFAGHSWFSSVAGKRAAW